MSYTRQRNWERVEMPESINMKLLRKAVFLNNNIFQAENKRYVEKILYNTQDEFVYFYPVTSEVILEMDASFALACSIVYTAIMNKENITKYNLLKLNEIYQQLKEEYGNS